MTRQQQQLIHVACRDLGLDAETRHDLQLRVTGKASLSDMTEAEQGRVLDELKRQGFKAHPGRPRKLRPAAPRADVRLCHVLWSRLYRAGAVDKGGAAGLNAFVRARFGEAWGAAPIDIDTLRDHRQIAAVIEALKAMSKRAGIDPK